MGARRRGVPPPPPPPRLPLCNARGDAPPSPEEPTARADRRFPSCARADEVLRPLAPRNGAAPNGDSVVAHQHLGALLQGPAPRPRAALPQHLLDPAPVAEEVLPRRPPHELYIERHRCPAWHTLAWVQYLGPRGSTTALTQSSSFVVAIFHSARRGEASTRPSRGGGLLCCLLYAAANLRRHVDDLSSNRR